MPPITAAASTTAATSSEHLIDPVNDVHGLTLHISHSDALFLTCFLLWFSIPSHLVDKDEMLNPENDTIGILVSTALNLAVGGKTIKPAGEQTATTNQHDR